MSGHSKWANIRVRKGAQDAKRGKIFTRHARLIEMAARGGPDPSSNASLRAAIDNAKAESVPNANIERAIKKGSGGNQGEQMQEIVYEAYGPGGAAFIVETLTDNRNRTNANVRGIISKHGGRMAEGGAVGWMFDRKGVIVADVPAGKNLEELELELIDFGAEDFSNDGQTIRVITSMTDWNKMRDFLKSNGCEIHSAGLSYVAKQKAPIADAETMEKVSHFMELIEEDDDVSEVHTNAEMQ